MDGQAANKAIHLKSADATFQNKLLWIFYLFLLSDSILSQTQQLFHFKQNDIWLLKLFIKKVL